MALPITVNDIKARLVGLEGWLNAAALCSAQYDDERILETIPAGIRRFERETQFRINQVQIVTRSDGAYAPVNATTGEVSINDTPGLPVVEEDPYDYYLEDAGRYFALTLRSRPVIKLQRLRVMWNSTDVVFTVPIDWLTVNKKLGKMHMLPTRGAALLAGATVAFSQISMMAAQLGYVPNITCMDYVAGLPSGWELMVEWSDLARSLSETCAYMVLNDISDLFDAGVIQKTISADGASQQIQYERFQRRKAELSQSTEKFKQTIIDQQQPIMMVAI